ncbi:MAG TPA: energy transducer TonB [Candidatus Eisenbacteria bacterium]
MERLEIRPPRQARAWLARVAPERPRPMTLPLPAAAPDTLVPESPAPPVLAVTPGLVPPVLRDAAPLALPASLAASRRFESVELDVRVSEAGDVTDVVGPEAGGDPALVAAASACARRMRFYPARRDGVPVAVWCRQRFDFGPGAEARP